MKQDIIKCINSLSGRYSPYNIFSDWIEMYALSISNACELNTELYDKREKQIKMSKIKRPAFTEMLDGKEVVDEQIEYQVDGEEYYLYPVPGEWCN